MIEGRTGLDSPKFQGRLRIQSRRSDYERRFVGHARGGVISDIRPPVRVQPLAQPAASSFPGATATMTQPKIKVISPDIRPPAPRQPQVAAMVHTRKSPSRVLKRQGVQAPLIAPPVGTARKIRNAFNIRSLTTVAAVMVVLGGLGVGLHGLRVNKEVAAKTTELAAASQSTAHSGTDAPDIPAETSSPDVSKYTVAADLPRTITIDKIGVKARVVRLGIKANNQLATPANIFDAGWYSESSKPGEAGAMVIDGHVSGPTKTGVFYKLHMLAAGDQMKIDRGDGKTYTYKVVKKASYAADKVDMAAVLTPVTPGKPGLNLITCSGEIDRTNNHYKDRTVVFAEQI